MHITKRGALYYVSPTREGPGACAVRPTDRVEVAVFNLLGLGITVADVGRVLCIITARDPKGFASEFVGVTYEERIDPPLRLHVKRLGESVYSITGPRGSATIAMHDPAVHVFGALTGIGLERADIHRVLDVASAKEQLDESVRQGIAYEDTRGVVALRNEP